MFQMNVLNVKLSQKTENMNVILLITKKCRFLVELFLLPQGVMDLTTKLFANKLDNSKQITNWNQTHAKFFKAKLQQVNHGTQIKYGLNSEMCRML